MKRHNQKFSIHDRTESNKNENCTNCNYCVETHASKENSHPLARDAQDVTRQTIMRWCAEAISDSPWDDTGDRAAHDIHQNSEDTEMNTGIWHSTIKNFELSQCWINVYFKIKKKAVKIDMCKYKLDVASDGNLIHIKCIKHFFHIPNISEGNKSINICASIIIHAYHKSVCTRFQYLTRASSTNSNSL